MMEMTVEAPIWGAGCPKMFGWQQHGFGRLGVGVREDILRQHSQVKINFKQGSIKGILVDCQTALKYAETYKSFQYLRGGIKIIIFPVLAFQIIKEEKPEIDEWDLNSIRYPELDYKEVYSLRLFFKGKTKEEIIAVGEKTKDEWWDAFLAKNFERADKIAKRLNYWRKLYEETFC